MNGPSITKLVAECTQETTSHPKVEVFERIAQVASDDPLASTHQRLRAVRSRQEKVAGEPPASSTDVL